jgi:hypothetical protein
MHKKIEQLLVNEQRYEDALLIKEAQKEQIKLISQLSRRLSETEDKRSLS